MFFDVVTLLTHLWLFDMCGRHDMPGAHPVYDHAYKLKPQYRHEEDEQSQAERLHVCALYAFI